MTEVILNHHVIDEPTAKDLELSLTVLRLSQMLRMPALSEVEGAQHDKARELCRKHVMIAKLAQA